MFGRKKDQPAPKPREWLKRLVGGRKANFTSRAVMLERMHAASFQRPLPTGPDGIAPFAMDSASPSPLKSASAGVWGLIPEGQMGFFASQGFIGHQACAIIAQHWLVRKACYMPARDAVRNGWKISAQDGQDVPPEILDHIAQCDKSYNIHKNLVEFVGMGRVFGIRVAMMIVDSGDPDFYEFPFNIDGVRPGAYKGIAQIDPYWISPILGAEEASNPASIHFYEPTHWLVNGRRVHRSHLIIYKTCDVADVLKPTYLYGGIPLPQQLAERIYCAERTANEAPLLAMTKRLNVLATDMEMVTANPEEADARAQILAKLRDSYGVLFIDKIDEDFKQTDTPLADFDALIMTQYQLVASIAGVPATKLLGTTPKGFNTTGEFEEASYHEELASIQAGDMQPLLERHYQLLLKSEGLDLSVQVAWNPLDEMTAAEQADVNLKKAQTAQTLAAIGAIDGTDERARLIADVDSGYSGMSNEPPEAETEEGGGEIDDIPAPAIEGATQAAASAGLNGAQIASLLDLLAQVSAGTLTPETAQVLLTTAFPIGEAKAAELLSNAGPSNAIAPDH